MFNDRKISLQLLLKTSGNQVQIAAMRSTNTYAHGIDLWHDAIYLCHREGDIILPCLLPGHMLQLIWLKRHLPSINAFVEYYYFAWTSTWRFQSVTLAININNVCNLFLGPKRNCSWVQCMCMVNTNVWCSKSATFWHNRKKTWTPSTVDLCLDHTLSKLEHQTYESIWWLISI